MRSVTAMAVVASIAVILACGASTTPPTEPRSSERDCSEDSECVFRPDDPCGCAPCGTAWRRSVNQEAAAELLRERALDECAEQECPDCEVEWRGTEPVCVNGQCSVRHTL